MPFMKVSPPGLDFSTLKVTMPEDPVIKEFEQQRATLQELDLAPLSPVSTGSLLSSSLSVKRAGTPTMLRQSPSKRDMQRSQTPTGPGSPMESPPSSVPLPPQSRAGDIIPNGPPIWQDIARFLRNPLKPAVLAMSRPDAKKNLTTLVKAFGEHAMLRELANLVLILVRIIK